MSAGKVWLRGWRQFVLEASLAVCGVATIVGSGGGLAPGFPDYVPPGPITPSPSVFVEPRKTTVQAGSTVTFTATTYSATIPVALQWRRNGVDIAGATGVTYQLAGATVADSGTTFSVLLTAANGTDTAYGFLQVSSSPGVVYQDGDFSPAQWSAAVIATPAAGPTQTVSQALTGGHPDSFRSISYQMTPGPSDLVVLHTSTVSTYDPSTQGGVLAIDFQTDCICSGDTAYAGLMLEQGMRRFWSTTRRGCSGEWGSVSLLSLTASDIAQVDGPPCGAAETCPDFSVQGAPIKLGLATRALRNNGEPAVSISQGVDNWKVTVWRK